MPDDEDDYCPALMPQDGYTDSYDLYSQVRANTVWVGDLYANGDLSDRCSQKYGLQPKTAPVQKKRESLRDFLKDSYPGQQVRERVCEREDRMCRWDLGPIHGRTEIVCDSEECDRIVRSRRRPPPRWTRRPGYRHPHGYWRPGPYQEAYGYWRPSS